MKILPTLLFLLAFWWDREVLAQNETQSQWAGCFDENGSLVKMGSPMLLCLHVGNSRNWTSGAETIQLAFSPKADEYSRFHVPDSFIDLTSTGSRFEKNSLTVGVAVQRSVSFLRLFKEGEDSGKAIIDRKIYPHLTAIVDVKDGVVRGITWDDACIFCGGFGCDEITYDFSGNLQDKDSAEQPTGGCGNTLTECEEKHKDGAAAGRTDCDLVLYVVWTGTDVDGKNMLSSANRFSAFPAQELRDRLTQNLPDRVKDAGNSFNNNNNNATNRDL